MEHVYLLVFEVHPLEASAETLYAYARVRGGDRESAIRWVDSRLAAYPRRQLMSARAVAAALATQMLPIQADLMQSAQHSRNRGIILLRRSLQIAVSAPG